MNKKKGLQEFLPGLEETMPEELFMIAEILQQNVFELYMEGETVYIPYMMNDAVECYLVLQKVVVKGEHYPKEGIRKARLAKRDDQYALIIYQEDGHVFTLWFQDIRMVLECYQYHQIGHFWRKNQEQWRQLVYIIGTIYEKYEYFGERVCNPLEVDILPLIEFAPFRHWSPIHESLEEKYPATYEGIDCMENLALAASDYWYAGWIRFYRKFPRKWVTRALSRMLTHPAREKLYQVIWNRVIEASSEYGKRNYSYEINQEIKRQRTIVDEELKKDGYEGEYPSYHKENIFVQATEEHPFTVLEAEDFTFKIQLMISQCMDKKPEHNSGFFKSWRRKGWILNTSESET